MLQCLLRLLSKNLCCDVSSAPFTNPAQKGCSPLRTGPERLCSVHPFSSGQVCFPGGEQAGRGRLGLKWDQVCPITQGQKARQGKSAVEQLSEGRGQPAQATLTCADTAEEEIIQALETSQCFPSGLVIPLVSLPACQDQMNITHRRKHFGPQKEWFQSKRHTYMAVGKNPLCYCPCLTKCSRFPKGSLLWRGDRKSVV